MQEENSKGLENLIKNIKAQLPLIHIEGIESMSKGFFSTSTALFQNWIKPVGIAFVGVVIVLTTFF